MRDFIWVRVLSLRELFSGEFEFRLPWFQRAYAWRPGEVGRLFNDIVEAMRQSGEDRHYYLGNIMLAKARDNADTALVDGHQRVMTFTILFAVLRDLAHSPTAKAAFDLFIKGSAYRLQPQEALADFVERYVQAPGATQVEIEEEPKELSETERNIIDNREHLKNALENADAPPLDLEELAAFLADGCFLSVTVVGNEQEAWRFLQIEERTRLNFNPAARAKASVLAMVPAPQREPCRTVWERAEQRLGSEDMYALLGFLRTLKTRRLSEKPAETELAEVANLNHDGLGFFVQELEPGAQRLDVIRRREIGLRSRQSEIAAHLDRTGWIAPQVWLPAALLWLEKRGEGSTETPLFFARIERLMWMLRLAGFDSTRQQRHVLKILSDIDHTMPVRDMPSLDINQSIRAEALKSLRIQTFDSRRYAARLLRRISVAAGQDPGPIHAEHCTLEHMLPTGWLDTSGWREDFTTPKLVKAHAHKLGNLTFLTGPENREADSKDWGDKSPIYSNSRFVLSKEAAGVALWNAKAIDERTNRLISLLFQSWDLPV